MPKQVFTKDFCGKNLTVEVGEISKQADGAALIRYNETVILSTVCYSDEEKDQDFFPLTVSYEEKMYAVGKIPGGFLRREGRPTEFATLSSRLIDRPIRPLFPEGFKNEVQVVNTAFSVDPSANPVMAALFGSGLVLGISEIPFDGPVAGVKVGRINGKFVINPSEEEMKASDLDLTVAGTKKAINMVESGAAELDESVMLEAIMFGHDAIKELVAFQEEIIAAVGKTKKEFKLFFVSPEIQEAVNKVAKEGLHAALAITKKLAKQEALDKVIDDTLAPYKARKDYEDEAEKKHILMEVKEACEVIIRAEVRRLIGVEKLRPDGRNIDEIRPLDAQVDLLPRTHGSAMFTRGETQVISSVTLAPASEYQKLENTTDEEQRRFMHHYNFPPFSVGETGRVGNPGRREIGHGALGERALSYVIPSEADFPYTIRVVSEVCESNGSSSQASICASTMALMAAGVPLKAPVAGIAMGLITSGPLESGAPYTVLTDIQGMEDHLGDMDFKVAGTRDGVTALQMDIKISGINRDILEIALKQAHKARMQILDLIESTIPTPREKVGKYAPKIRVLHIGVDKIRDVIGKGGEVINDIIAKCDNVKIDIEQDGTVKLYHSNYEPLDKAAGIIESIAKVAKVGEIYYGEVVRIEAYGVFVNLFSGCDGLCHVSKLANERVEHPSSIFKVGDKDRFIVTGIDEKGKVSLSRKDLLPKPEKKPVVKEAE